MFKKYTKIMRNLRLFLCTLLMLIAVGASAEQIVPAVYKKVKDVKINGVTYTLYDVSAKIDLSEYSDGYSEHFLGHQARIRSLKDVTAATCVIPSVVYEGDVEYYVEGMSKDYKYVNSNSDANYDITSLIFEGPIGLAYEGKGDYFYAHYQRVYWRVQGSEGEDNGLDFTFLHLVKLKALYFNKIRAKPTVNEWEFSYNVLRDVYFTQNRPSLLEGMFESTSHQITAHVTGSITELKNAAVWCNFKDIVPYQDTYDLNIKNNSSGEVEVCFMGYDVYSDFSANNPPQSQESVGPNSAKSVGVSIAKNYLLKVTYDPATCNRPTIKRQGKVVTPFTIDARTLGYQVTDVQEDLTLEIEDNYKQCQLSFNATGDYKAGTYTVRSNGQTIQGNISSANFINCDYGSEVTLSMPATPYLLRDNLTLNKYSSTVTTENLTLPSPVDGNYTIAFSVPEVGSARFNYAYIIPEPVADPDPVITIMRTGNAEVSVHAFWNWDEQSEDYHDWKTVKCINTLTQFVIPKPTYDWDLGGTPWGFTMTIKPVKGEILKDVLIGEIIEDENDHSIMSWTNWNGEYLSTLYDEATNTYTITISGDDYMIFYATDYNVMLNIGPEHTVIEQGNKQTFLRRGGKGNVYVNYEENYGDYDPGIEVGTTTITIPDYNSDDCTYAALYIDKVRGEKFTAYRDGVDVTSEFTSMTSYYRYDFDSDDKKDNRRQSSTWTLIFEKDENVVTSYDWTVMCANGISGYLSYTYPDDTVTEDISKPLGTYTFNEEGLQSATLTIMAEEGVSLLFMCDGIDVSSQATYQDNIKSYVITIPAVDMLNHTWFIDYAQNAADANQWTIVQTDNVEGAEVTLTRDGSSETTALTEPSTQVDISNAESATLKVPIDATYKLYLTGYNSEDKPGVVKAAIGITGLGLKEAKDLVEQSFPILIKTFATLAEVQTAETTLKAAGTSVTTSIKSPSNVKVLCDGVDVTAEGQASDGYLSFTVSAADLTSSIWVILTESVLDSYDVNGDGQITIADVTKLVNKIPGQGVIE